MNRDVEKPRTSQRRASWPRAGIITTLVLWGVATIGGFWSLWTYEAKPGRQGQVPIHIANRTSDLTQNSRSTLILFLHPNCPCSRATLNEIGRIMTQSGDKTTARVVFSLPSGWSSESARTSLYKMAESIPGVSVNIDVDGAEARRFGAATSGQAMLYTPDGRLIFSGGITSARGHEGDNAGESAVLDLLNGNKSTVSRTPVYGCALFNDATASVDGKASQ